MPSTLRILELWAADLRGLYPALVQRAAGYAEQLLPPQPSVVEQTVLARWTGLVLWLEHTTRHELKLSEEAALRYWRSLRAVAENRAAPTSPLGLAITSIVADIRRLPQVEAADQMLLSLAVAELLDGLAMRYRWRLDAYYPTPAEELSALARASGTLGLYASVSALRGWDLAALMPAHPVRRLIVRVGEVRALLASPDAAERAAKAQQTVADLLAQLEPRWASLHTWTTQLAQVPMILD